MKKDTVSIICWPGCNFDLTLDTTAIKGRLVAKHTVTPELSGSFLGKLGLISLGVNTARSV